jgi:hypothetical protein
LQLLTDHLDRRGYVGFFHFEGAIMKSGKFSTFNRRALHAALASAVALGGTGFGSSAYAITADASANVVQAVTVAQNRALNFGKFVAQNGGTVILSNAATTVVTGTSVKVSPSTAASGQFTVTGDGAATYTLTADASTTLTGTDSSTMAVTAITPSVTTGGVLSGSSGSAGTQIVYIGATVTQGASNGAGLYSGTYSVTVAYN